jgi:outer membrane biosynthesis protein TonB
VLILIQDFFFVCPGHLKDRGFCNPIIDEAALAAKKKKEMEAELERVKQEFEEKQKKKKEKEKEKEKEKGKGKDKDKSKKDDDDEEGKPEEKVDSSCTVYPGSTTNKTAEESREFYHLVTRGRASRFCTKKGILSTTIGQEEKR